MSAPTRTYERYYTEMEKLLAEEPDDAQGATDLLYNILLKAHPRDGNQYPLAQRADYLINECGANPIAVIDRQNDNGQNVFQFLFHKALSHVDLRDVVEVFLESGVPASMTQRDHMAPIHYAAMCGDVKMMELLIDHGANVDAKDGPPFLKTPLYYAAKNGDEALRKGDLERSKTYKKICQRLLEEGADPYHVVHIPTGYGNDVGTIAQLVPFLDNLLHENKRKEKREKNKTEFWREDATLISQIHANLVAAIDEYQQNHKGDRTIQFLQQYVIGDNDSQTRHEQLEAIDRYQQITRLLSADANLDTLCRPLCEDEVTGNILSGLVEQERTMQRVSRKAVASLVTDDADAEVLAMATGNALDQGKKFVARVGRREALTGALGLALLAMGFANEQQGRPQQEETNSPRDRFITRVNEIMRHSSKPITDARLGELYDNVTASHSRMSDVTLGAAGGYAAASMHQPTGYVGASVESVVKYLSPAIEGIIEWNAPHQSGFQELEAKHGAGKRRSSAGARR